MADQRNDRAAHRAAREVAVGRQAQRAAVEQVDDGVQLAEEVSLQQFAAGVSLLQIEIVGAAADFDPIFLQRLRARGAVL